MWYWRALALFCLQEADCISERSRTDLTRIWHMDRCACAGSHSALRAATLPPPSSLAFIHTARPGQQSREVLSFITGEINSVKTGRWPVFTEFISPVRDESSRTAQQAGYLQRELSTTLDQASEQVKWTSEQVNLFWWSHLRDMQMPGKYNTIQ